MSEELNKYLDSLVKDNVFPGCNYVIVTKSNNYIGSVGSRSIVPNKEVNNINTLYDIASLTKVLVTNTLISILIEEGKIKLDDYVYKYIDDFKYKNIKIIHLLTHSSGLKRLYDSNNLKDKGEFINNIESIFDPGLDVMHADINFILLGFIIEKMYNNTLDVLANKYIFKPLNMNNTCFNPKDNNLLAPTEYINNKLLIGEAHDPKTRFLNGVSGTSGVFTDITDISNFITMVLHDGFYNGKKYLDTNIIDMWFTPLFIGEDNLRKTIGWTYGKSSIMVNKYCSDNTIYHSGFTGCHMFIDRDNDFGFALLSNRVHPTSTNELLINKREEINNYIYKLLKKYDEIY